MPDRDTDTSVHLGGGDHSPPPLPERAAGQAEAALDTEAEAVLGASNDPGPQDPTESARRRTVISRRLAVTLIIFGMLALFIGASVLVVQPQACESCHRPHADALAQSTHVEVTCAECHTSGGRWGSAGTAMRALFVMVPSQLVGGSVRGNPGVRISRDACEQCHSRGMETAAESGGMRINHGACAAPPTKCDTCHGAVAHGKAVRWPRAPEMEPCIACHRETAATTECDLCHVGRLPEDRITSGPWRVTHGPTWKSTHGMGELSSCGTCHEADTCIRCHNIEVPHGGGFLVSHGKEALKPTNKCAVCHKSKAWCDACHGMAMPHPSGFLAQHSRLAKGTRDPKCVNCHRVDDCARCHEAHVHPGLPDDVLKQLTPRRGGRS